MSQGPWGLRSSPPGTQRNILLSRKSWILLAALGILSLAAWTTVALWPKPEPNVAGIVDAPAPAVPLLPNVRDQWKPAPTQVTTRPLSRDSNAGSAEASSKQPPRREILDETGIAELNSRLSTLLDILSEPGQNSSADPNLSADPTPLPEAGLDRNSAETPPFSPKASLMRPEPEVHVLVRSRPGQGTLEDIRKVEEALGQALQEENWQKFDQEYLRLSHLKPHAEAALGQWRAARAMAENH